MTADPHDLHAGLTTVTDRLLERVAVLTRAMQAGGAGLSEKDRVEARLMLEDLRLVAASWRSVHAEAARRLDAAATDLAEATAILNRALDESHA
jgi:hypothetical protein